MPSKRWRSPLPSSSSPYTSETEHSDEEEYHHHSHGRKLRRTAGYHDLGAASDNYRRKSSRLGGNYGPWQDSREGRWRHSGGDYRSSRRQDHSRFSTSKTLTSTKLVSSDRTRAPLPLPPNLPPDEVIRLLRSFNSDNRQAIIAGAVATSHPADLSRSSTSNLTGEETLVNRSVEEIDGLMKLSLSEDDEEIQSHREGILERGMVLLSNAKNVCRSRHRSQPLLESHLEMLDSFSPLLDSFAGGKIAHQLDVWQQYMDSWQEKITKDVWSANSRAKEIREAVAVQLSKLRENEKQKDRLLQVALGDFQDIFASHDKQRAEIRQQLKCIEKKYHQDAKRVPTSEELADRAKQWDLNFQRPMGE